MNRRIFFKTIGIPALALPFVKIIKPTENSSMEIWVDQEYLDTSFPYHIQRPAFGVVKIYCPRCLKELSLPYIKGEKPSKYLIDVVCPKCHISYSKEVSVYGGKVRAFYDP